MKHHTNLTLSATVLPHFAAAATASRIARFSMMLLPALLACSSGNASTLDAEDVRRAAAEIQSIGCSEEASRAGRFAVRYASRRLYTITGHEAFRATLRELREHEVVLLTDFGNTVTLPLASLESRSQRRLNRLREHADLIFKTQDQEKALILSRVYNLDTEAISADVLSAIALKHNRLFIQTLSGVSADSLRSLASKWEGGLAIELSVLELATDEQLGVLAGIEQDLAIVTGSEIAPSTMGLHALEVLSRDDGCIEFLFSTSFGDPVASALAGHRGELRIPTVTFFQGESASLVAQHPGDIDFGDLYLKKRLVDAASWEALKAHPTLGPKLSAIDREIIAAKEREEAQRLAGLANASDTYSPGEAFSENARYEALAEAARQRGDMEAYMEYKGKAGAAVLPPGSSLRNSFTPGNSDYEAEFEENQRNMERLLGR